jgi:hypothetical protein
MIERYLVDPNEPQYIFHLYSCDNNDSGKEELSETAKEVLVREYSEI